MQRVKIPILFLLVLLAVACIPPLVHTASDKSSPGSSSISVIPKMAGNNDRVVFPDENVKTTASAAAVSEKPKQDKQQATTHSPHKTTIGLRNMITVPTNCPDGYALDPNGVCREKV